MRRRREEKGPWRPDRSRYAHAADLSPFGWAWEFLRRSPAYLADAGAHVGHGAGGDASMLDGFVVVDQPADPRAARFGLDHFVDPEIAIATVFWTPEALGGDLAVVLQEGREAGLQGIALAEIPGRKAALVRAGSPIRILVESTGYAEILSAPAAPLSNDSSVAPAAGGWRGIDVRLGRLAAFSAYCKADGRPPPHRPRAPQLTDTLIALDGWLDGRAYREIAHAFHDEGTIEADWRGAGAIKLRMRRRVAAGLALMEGGYRRLLTLGLARALERRLARRRMRR